MTRIPSFYEFSRWHRSREIENFIKMFTNQDGTDHEKLDKVDSTKIKINQFTNEDGKDGEVGRCRKF